MVAEYLEKIRDDLQLQRQDLLDQESAISNKIKENIKFISLLEESEDPNASAFTPREIHGFQKNKIEELRLEQKDLSQSLENTQKELAELSLKYDEVCSVIRVSKEDTVSLQKSEYTNNPVFKRMMLQTQELERQRIARDLHDSTVQNLTSLVHKSEFCMKLMDVDPIRSKLELSSINMILRDVINELRGLIYDLRPMSFDDIGFDVTVDRFLDKLRNSTSIRFEFLSEGDAYPLDNVIYLTLLRVIQEACNNAVKHANPSLVKVKLSYEANEIRLSIKDDGKGMDLSTLPEVSREDNSGFGLSMMKERVYLLSGMIDFVSEPDQGCEIVVVIPVLEEDLENG